jgi:hypothetical protein
VASVKPVRGVKFVDAFVPQHAAPISGFPVSAACGSTGAGAVPDVPDDWPAVARTAKAPVRVIPEIRNTSRPPPVEPLWGAVQTVPVAEPIRALRTQTVRFPDVENPVRVESTLV